MPRPTSTQIRPKPTKPERLASRSGHHDRVRRRDRHILIVGSKDDPHIEAVSKICRSAGADCTIVTEDSLVTVCFNVCGTEGAALQCDPSAVWWRLKPGFFRVEEYNSPSLFMQREWHHVLEAFEGLFDKARWMNPRAVDRVFRHKPQQLRHAQSCGLQIPRTLISNDPSRVLDFVRHQPVQRCVFKPLNWYSERPDRQLFTNYLNIEEIRSMKDAIRRAPGIYQEIVPKQYEIRITVVENKIFPIRIYSQNNPETRVDWRRNHFGVSHEIDNGLPKLFLEALLEFHKSSGLVYGAYDFVVTPQTEFVFLEVNPVGQWLWLEESTGVAISSAVAAALLREMTP